MATQSAEDGRADEEHVVAADLVDQHAQDRGAERAAQAGAAADEAEQPLGLARVVDLVGQRPELADEKTCRAAGRASTEPTVTQTAPVCSRTQNTTSSATMAELGDRNDAPAGQPSRTALLYRCISTPMRQTDGELHERLVVGAELVDELRTR